MTQEVQLSFIKKWWVSIRPFSLPASTMPVVFGTVLATVFTGYSFNLLHFLLAFFGMVILHAAANILSDVYDFKKGLDKFPTPVSGGVVRGIISQKEAKTAAYLLFTIGTIIGLLLVYLSGPWLLAIGMLGLFIGFFYTSSNPLSMKYHGLGDFAVFMNFGILGSLGAWYVQSGELSWLPVIWAIPMSVIVIGILHANNWRDIQSDKEGEIFTIASMIGDKHSLHYYWFLNFGPFILITLFILFPYFWLTDLIAMPFSFFITFLALPLAIKLWKKAVNRHNPKDPLDFITLDGGTAQLNLLFGVLCTLAVFLDALIKMF